MMNVNSVANTLFDEASMHNTENNQSMNLKQAEELNNWADKSMNRIHRFDKNSPVDNVNTVHHIVIMDLLKEYMKYRM